MTKYLRVTMPAGSKWDVPAQIIAKNRAQYYARRDPAARESGADPEEIYAQEFAYTMACREELIDWAANNMQWSDVKAHASLVETPSDPDYADGWVNGEKQVVEK